MYNYTINKEYFKVKSKMSKEDIGDFFIICNSLMLKRNSFIVSTKIFYKVVSQDLKIDMSLLKCASIVLATKITECIRPLSTILDVVNSHFEIKLEPIQVIFTEITISEALDFEYNMPDYFSYCAFKTSIITRDRDVLLYTFSFLNDCCFLPLFAYLSKRNIAFGCIFLALKIIKPEIFSCNKANEKDSPRIENTRAELSDWDASKDLGDEGTFERKTVRKISHEKLIELGIISSDCSKEKDSFEMEEVFLLELEEAFKGFEYNASEIHFTCNELLIFYEANFN